MNRKPLGIKNYGSIPHLPNSRIGKGDHHCSEGQARIATIKKRDKHDFIIVQEKLDGSNVGVAKLNGTIIPLSRAGYRAETSPYELHHKFADWVMTPENYKRFYSLLNENERLVGEWLLQAHGTRYKLPHEPFVAFDLMINQDRLPFDQLKERLLNLFVTPKVIEYGNPITVDEALKRLGKYGFHGALDQVEGVVWRVERNRQIHKNSGERKKVVDFLVKFVRPEKEDGIYLPEQHGGVAIWNESCRVTTYKE